jgi:hypothetical protein
MGRFTWTRFRALPIPAFLLPVLIPTAASAGWGNENWGEMVWGAAAPQIPSMPVEGLIALAVVFLCLSYALFALRRTRAKRAPLHS